LADSNRNIVQHSDNAPNTFDLLHLPGSGAVFGHETNCKRTKLHAIPVSYLDSRTDLIRSTAITKRTSRDSSTNGSRAVARCVCVCVCVRV
jgi:hypothetical protein